MKKYIYGFLLYCVFALVALPVFLLNYTEKTEAAQVITLGSEEPKTVETKAIEAKEDMPVDVVINQPKTEDTKLILGEKTSMEEYIIGVVAAEMPALFETEALKAQAVAARTYAVNQMKGRNIGIEDMIAGNSQAYITTADMKKKWGDGFDQYYKKIEAAVLSNSGEIMVYENQPILAVFHAISRGKTETAENVWNEAMPYLKSVDSQMDMQAAEYSHEISIPVKTVAALLQKSQPSLKLYDGSLKEQMQVIDRTEAGYVDNMQIGNVTFTGREVREALGLRSSDFTIKQEGNEMIFATNGYGHGAGMSQYGANFMARDGKTYKEILQYYYSGIEFEKIKQ